MLYFFSTSKVLVLWLKYHMNSHVTLKSSIHLKSSYCIIKNVWTKSLTLLSLNFIIHNKASNHKQWTFGTHATQQNSPKFKNSPYLLKNPHWCFKIEVLSHQQLHNTRAMIQLICLTSTRNEGNNPSIIGILYCIRGA